METQMKTWIHKGKRSCSVELIMALFS